MSQRKLDNWLNSYLVYTNESESPEVFHLWCGISAIAGALQRRCWYDMGYFQVHPNLYTILVSPPGRCKKSTAMRIARNVLGYAPGVEFTVDSTTRERLILDMAAAYKDGQSAMTAYSSEFATMLTSSGMDMVAFLTDIFDSPIEWVHRTKSGGTNKIKAPSLNLIAATTPAWMATAMPLDTVGIGLTSRIIFVYSDTPRVRPPRPKITAAQSMIHELLIHDIERITHLKGEYTFDSPSTEAFYDDWYMRRGDTTLEDERLSGYFERKPIHLIKTCMAIAAAQRDELIMTTADIQAALGIIEALEEDMQKVFAHVGKNPIAHDIESVLANIIRQPGGVEPGVLMERFKHTVRREELLEVLDTLMMMNKIKLVGNKYIFLDEP